MGTWLALTGHIPPESEYIEHGSRSTQHLLSAKWGYLDTAVGTREEFQRSNNVGNFRPKTICIAPLRVSLVSGITLVGPIHLKHSVLRTNQHYGYRRAWEGTPWLRQHIKTFDTILSTNAYSSSADIF